MTLPATFDSDENRNDHDEKRRLQLTVLPSPILNRPDARPFLRWAGGKTRLLRDILKYVPRQFGNYHEPFLGGGALYFSVRSRAAGRCYLSDLNSELMNAWQVVRDRPREFLAALSGYDGRDAEKDYYLVRGATPRGRIMRAARFLYLNQTAWNGLWRVNARGIFNVPWGARPFRSMELAELRVVSAILRDAILSEQDFRVSMMRPVEGDFVYLDPPYLPISDTSKFSGYTERRFRATDLVELSSLCRRLTSRGVYWILSNRDNAMIHDLFDHARIVRLTARRSVAAQNRRDIQPVNSPETIIIGGPIA